MSFASKTFLLLTAIVVVVHMAVWYPNLPAELPSKFSGGDVTAWMGKNPYLGLMGGIHVFMLLFAVVMPWLMKVLPVSMINIPHREYWLSDERREETMDIVATQVRFISILTSLLLLGLTHLSFLVAVGTKKSISPEFELIMGIYLGLIFMIVIWLVVRFRKPQQEIAFKDSAEA